MTARIPRHIKIGLIVLGIGFVITSGLFVNVIGRIQSLMVQDREGQQNPFEPRSQPLYAESDPPMQVKLFFPSVQGETILSVEEQSIFRSAELTNRAKQIVQKLLEGPRTLDLYPSIPKDTKLFEIFIDDSGLAYVDFSDTLAANHPGGMVNELATVYSIVNSLTYNLPEIRQVRILVGGAEKETLAGHCLLLPLEMDLSLTDASPPEQLAHAN